MLAAAKTMGAAVSGARGSSAANRVIKNVTAASASPMSQDNNRRRAARPLNWWPPLFICRHHRHKPSPVETDLRFSAVLAGPRVKPEDDPAIQTPRVGVLDARLKAGQDDHHVIYISQVYPAPNDRGAAARASRSLIVSPKPSQGIGATAMQAGSRASSSRKKQKKFAAASARSRSGERSSTFLSSPKIPPKSRPASPLSRVAASRRSFARGA